MEALSQTKKREEIEGNESKPAKQRKRSNGSEMLAYMRERADEELALRAKAEETKQIQMDKEAKRQEDLLKILAGQQNQQQEFQQQQLQLHQEAMKQQQQQFLQMQQMMANQQQQNFQMLMAILGEVFLERWWFYSKVCSCVVTIKTRQGIPEKSTYNIVFPNWT